MTKKLKVHPNDQRADVKNPNNLAFIENQRNRAKQLDPNHLPSKPPTHPVKKGTQD